MAKKIYTGVGGVARNVKGLYIGVGGVARKAKKAYIGVGGVARLCYEAGGSTAIQTFSYVVLNGGYEELSEEFQFEEGMTWAQFCNSSYNTGGQASFAVYHNLVETEYGGVYGGGGDVKGTDKIIAGEEYYTSSSG